LSQGAGRPFKSIRDVAAKKLPKGIKQVKTAENNGQITVLRPHVRARSFLQ